MGARYKLEDAQVSSTIKATATNDNTKRVGDGGSLYLIARRGLGFWSHTFRDPHTGRVKSKGLGSYADVTLKQARKFRDDHETDLRRLRQALKSGTAPAAAVHSTRHASAPIAGVTFREAAATLPRRQRERLGALRARAVCPIAGRALRPDRGQALPRRHGAGRGRGPAADMEGPER